MKIFFFRKLFSFIFVKLFFFFSLGLAWDDVNWWYRPIPDLIFRKFLLFIIWLYKYIFYTWVPRLWRLFKFLSSILVVNRFPNAYWTIYFLVARCYFYFWPPKPKTKPKVPRRPPDPPINIKLKLKIKFSAFKRRLRTWYFFKISYYFLNFKILFGVYFFKFCLFFFRKFLPFKAFFTFFIRNGFWFLNMFRSLPYFFRRIRNFLRSLLYFFRRIRAFLSLLFYNFPYIFRILRSAHNEFRRSSNYFSFFLVLWVAFKVFFRRCRFFFFFFFFKLRDFLLKVYCYCVLFYQRFFWKIFVILGYFFFSLGRKILFGTLPSFFGFLWLKIFYLFSGIWLSSYFNFATMVLQNLQIYLQFISGKLYDIFYFSITKGCPPLIFWVFLIVDYDMLSYPLSFFKFTIYVFSCTLGLLLGFLLFGLVFDFLIFFLYFLGISFSFSWVFIILSFIILLVFFYLGCLFVQGSFSTWLTLVEWHRYDISIFIFFFFWLFFFFALLFFFKWVYFYLLAKGFSMVIVIAFLFIFFSFFLYVGYVNFFWECRRYRIGIIF